MRLLLITLIVLLSIDVSGQIAVARLKFEDAEEAFNKGDYATTLSKLEDAEKLFGKINVPILHLRIIAQDKLLQKKLDFTMLSDLRKNCEKFLKDYETMDGIEEKYRQVYKIQEASAKYPSTQEEYQKQVLEKKAEEEKSKELAEMNAIGKIYLFRSTGFGGSGNDFEVFLNGQVVGRLGNKEYLTFDLPPGKYKLGVQFGKSSEIKKNTELTEVEVLPKIPRYLEVDYNSWNGDADVVVTTPEKAIEYFNKLKPIANNGLNLMNSLNRTIKKTSNIAALEMEMARTIKESSINQTSSTAETFMLTAPKNGPYLGIITQLAGNSLLVSQVIPRSPAAVADVRQYDLIIAINEQIPSASNDLSQIINRFQPGTEITLKLIRNGKQIEVKVVLSKMPDK